MKTYNYCAILVGGSWNNKVGGSGIRYRLTVSMYCWEQMIGARGISNHFKG